MPTRRSILAALLAAPMLARPALAQTPLKVVATTGMIADAARAIGGPLVEVTQLMGSGTDPHGYRQTRSDVAALARADLVLWNGLYLEAQLERLLTDLARRLPVTAVAEAVPAEALLRHADYEGRADPHLWMAPRLWKHAVEATRDALLALRADDRITANAAVYLKAIDGYDGLARERLATVPEPARVLVTAHDAFGYFGRDYGFEVLGIQGLSTQSEAGLARIADLVDTLVRRRIKAVFVESSVSDRNMRALIEGAAAEGHDVTIGGTLFSDAMGQPGTYEGTYLGMFDHNVTTITRALGGEVSDTGLFGRLGGPA